MTPRTILLQIFGLKPNEVSVLKSVCTLSAHSTRAHAHKIAAAAEHAEVYIVDGDDPVAQAQWRAAQGASARPCIVVTADGAQKPGGPRTLRRPLLASRLLAALDEVAVGDGGADVATTPPLAEAPARAAHGAGAAAAGVVLVVDDSPTIRKQLELVLRERSLEVVAVDSGEAALDRVAQQSFDLIFLDVVLPGTDGYQVCKAIKKDLDTRATPVVMLTGKGSPFDRLRGSLAGCDTYLTKPVSRADFDAVIARYLKPRVAEERPRPVMAASQS
ncbi:MAG TPA: response regulator [Burkholderiaceae bacterium]|nr:response regulator [Burkholderiaceae bacterium]